MHRVFISSTSIDLSAHREGVRDAVLRLGMYPVMMEHFPAMDADAVEACKRKVLDCDLFVGIYAHRYGYVPHGYTQSITELEYDWAKAAGLPRHLFVIKPDTTWPAEYTDAPDDHARLEAFKKRVGTGHVWSEFTTPDSLAAAVTQSLVHDAERLSREQAKQRRLMVGGLGAVLLLIIGVIATLILTRADEAKIGISQADRASTNQAIAQANATATATQWTPTPTPTPTFTPSNTPTPTATPLEGAIAVAGETLVLIADFTYIDPDATRIEPNLEREFEDAGIRFVRIHYPMPDRSEARIVLDTYNASVIIWGEAARGGVQVEFEVSPSALRFNPVRFDELSVSAFEVNSFDAYVFTGMDTRYIVEYTLGRILFAQEEYAEALRAFDRAVALIPEDRAEEVQAAWLYTMRGGAFDQLGDHETALEQYDIAASIAPDWGGPLALGASVAGALGDFAGAFRRATQALEIGLTTPLMSEQDTMDFVALTYLTRSIALNNLYRLGDPQGDLQQSKADMDVAIEAGEKFRAQNPAYDITNLYAQRSTVFQLLGDSEAALADYATAILQAPDDADLYLERGIFVQQLGQYEAAIEDFSKAIELDSEEDTAYRNRASAYIELAEWEAALDDINRAIELDPTYSISYSYRANIHYSLGNYEAAAADMTRAIELEKADLSDAEWALIYAVRGADYLQLGDYEAALADFDRAVSLDPTASHYLRRGLAQQGLLNFDDALADFTAAQELDAEYPLAYYFRARLYVDVYQDCEKAEADFAELNALGQTDSQLARDIQALCHPPTPTPQPQNAADPIFENGVTITLSSPLPLIILAEPSIAAAQVGVCTAGTTITVQHTIVTADTRRWVEIDCQGVIGWVEEGKLPAP